MATVVAGGNLAEFMLLLLAGHRVPSCTTGAFSGRFRGFRDAKRSRPLKDVSFDEGPLRLSAFGELRLMGVLQMSDERRRRGRWVSSFFLSRYCCRCRAMH